MPGSESVMGRAWGITGGIASGKTTVAQMIQNRGFLVIDADQIARQIVEPKTPGWQQVVKQFGSQILQADQQLNRQLLGQLVFNDPQQLAQLNQITQPLIRQELLQQITSAQRSNHLVFFEIPLLFEYHYQTYLNGVVLVDLPRKVQLKRLKKRNHLTQREAQRRISAQISRTARRHLASKIITNTGDYAMLSSKVNQLLRNLTS